MSMDLSELREKLELSQKQRGPIPAIELLTQVVDGILRYLEEEDSYRQDANDRE